MNKKKPKPSLPDVRLHLRYFIGGLIGYIGIGILATKFPDFPQGLLILLAIPCWIAIIVCVFGYYLVYPFVHLLGRYEGASQQTWLIWLVLDTVGLTFGLVRAWYYLAKIIPDFRRERNSRIESQKNATKTQQSNPLLASCRNPNEN